MLNVPTEFEGILKNLTFYEMLGLFNKFRLYLTIYIFMVWECMKFTRKISF